MNAVCLTDPPAVVVLKTEFRTLCEREEEFRGKIAQLKAARNDLCFEISHLNNEIDRARRRKAQIAQRVFNMPAQGNAQ